MKNAMSAWSLVALCSLTFHALEICPAAHAGDWQNWRGPFYNGSADETGLPSNFSKTDNVAWSVDLPGVASSTPIISGECVFLSSTDAAADSLLAMCFSRKDG